MKKLLKKIITGILTASMLLSSLVLMTGCGGGGLVGTWEHSGQTMEFSRNGNVTFRYSGESVTFTWETNAGRLTIMAPDGVMIDGPYEIVGSTLTIRDGGASQSWTRR